jgi:hypothetical protein
MRLVTRTPYLLVNDAKERRLTVCLGSQLEPALSDVVTSG